MRRRHRCVLELAATVCFLEILTDTIFLEVAMCHAVSCRNPSTSQCKGEDSSYTL